MLVLVLVLVLVPGAGAGAWCCLVMTGTVALPSVLWVLQTLYMNSKCQLISQLVSITQTKLRNELPLSGTEPWTSDTLSNDLRNGPPLHTNFGKQNILWKNFFFRNFFFYSESLNSQKKHVFEIAIFYLTFDTLKFFP